MTRLYDQSILKACEAAGMAAPPERRFPIRSRRHESRIHPCDRPRMPRQIPTHKAIDTDLPEESGIYFFWRDGRLFYVGQAVALRQRLLSHPMKKYCDEVAWVFYEREALNHAECFYIGLLRPIANFGAIERVRCDNGETYFDEERVGDILLSRTPTFKWPPEQAPPPGAILPFPAAARRGKP